MYFRKLSAIAALFWLSFFTTSCVTTYYAPNSHNAPLLSEKGQVKIQGGVGSGEETDKAEFEGAIAITDKYAAMANIALYYSDQSREGQLFEGALGYYHTLEDPRLIFEVFAGYGHASGSPNWSGAYANFKANRFFVQPDFGFSTDYFDAAISLRGSLANYYEVSQYPSGSNDPYGYYILPQGSNYFMMEPALTIRAGYKYIKLQIQGGLSYNLTAPDFPQDHINLSAMLVIDLKPSSFK